MESKIAVLIIVIILLSGIYEGKTINEIKNATNSNEIHTKNITMHFSPPEIIENGNKTKIIIKECNSMLYSAGMPILPEYKLILKFPFWTKIKNINCKVGNIKKMEISENISTTPFPICLKNGSILKFDREHEIHPDSWLSYRIGAGIDDENHVIFLPIHFYPIRYIFNKSEIEYTDSISVQISYEALPHSINNSIYDLVIITPSESVNGLKKLADYKEQHGIKTKIVTLDEIYNGKYFEARGRDNAEKIKYFLKDALDNWGIKYVLLVGDIWHTPARRVYSFLWGRNGMLSDYYYADIYDANRSFCSWDSNRNDKFGEVGKEGDKVDLYADLYVGRLLCYDLNELNTVVDKIINYECNASQWFNRFILMGGDTFPIWNDIAEGEVVNEYVEKATPGFEHIKIQTSLHNFLPNKINEIWSQGSGFICYSGHGFEYGFGTYPKNKRWMIAYYTPYLLWLKNGNKLPVIFFDACLTSKLDYRMLGNPHIPCFSWCLVKKPDGGAIATIGATESATTTVTENGPIGQAGYLDLHFFMAYKNGTTPSKMLVKAKNDYLNDIASGNANDRFYEMTLEQFILFGDPSLTLK